MDEHEHRQGFDTTITSGSSSGKNLSGFNIASAESNTLTITVTEGDVTDVYTVKTVRIDPSLTKLSLDGIKINETFVSTKKLTPRSLRRTALPFWQRLAARATP